MTKRFVILVLLALAFLAMSFPVQAQAAGNVYVDTAYTGTEDGTQEKPYNTLLEGRAFAQAQAGGAWLYVKQADGSWLRQQYIPPAISGNTGTPITTVLQYALLALLAAVLIFLGWQFQRRSRLLRA